MGVDEQAYLAALQQVPVISKERLRVVMEAQARLAQMLATMGLEHKLVLGTSATFNADLIRAQQHIALMLHTAQMASSSLEPAQVLERIADAMVAAVGVPYCGIYLMDAERGVLVPHVVRGPLTAAELEVLRVCRLEDAAAGEGGPGWRLPVGWIKGGIDFFLRYFYADTRADWGRRRGTGYVPSFLMGMFFSAGWTPCIGPTLGAILALGYSTATISQGTFLLSGYSLGLGIPFVLFALALDRASGLLRSLKRHMRMIQLMNGVLLMLIGFALLTKQLAIIARWAQENNLYLEAGFLGWTTPTFFIAILAGLLSFLSPCVLPLVPAYVFYLTGRTFSKTTAN